MTGFQKEDDQGQIVRKEGRWKQLLQALGEIKFFFDLALIALLIIVCYYHLDNQGQINLLRQIRNIREVCEIPNELQNYKMFYRKDIKQVSTKLLGFMKDVGHSPMKFFQTDVFFRHIKQDMNKSGYFFEECDHSLLQQFQRTPYSKALWQTIKVHLPLLEGKCPLENRKSGLFIPVNIVRTKKIPIANITDKVQKTIYHENLISFLIGINILDRRSLAVGRWQLLYEKTSTGLWTLKTQLDHTSLLPKLTIRYGNQIINNDRLVFFVCLILSLIFFTLAALSEIGFNLSHVIICYMKKDYSYIRTRLVSMINACNGISLLLLITHSSIVMHLNKLQKMALDRIDEYYVENHQSLTLARLDFSEIRSFDVTAYYFLKVAIVINGLKSFYQQKDFFFRKIFGIYLEALVITVLELKLALSIWFIQSILFYIIFAAFSHDHQHSIWYMFTNGMKFFMSQREHKTNIFQSFIFVYHSIFQIVFLLSFIKNFTQIKQQELRDTQNQSSAKVSNVNLDLSQLNIEVYDS